MAKVENDGYDGDDKQWWRDDAHDNHDGGHGMEMMVMMNE